MTRSFVLALFASGGSAFLPCSGQTPPIPTSTNLTDTVEVPHPPSVDQPDELYKYFTPFIGFKSFPTKEHPTYTIDPTGVVIFKGLPSKPYYVLGDISMDDAVTRDRALSHACHVAQLAHANAIILAGSREVFAQEIHGQEDGKPIHLRAWAIVCSKLPDAGIPSTGITVDGGIQPNGQTLLDAPQRPHESAPMEQLREELRDNALKQAKAEIGIVPQGFTYTSYMAFLEHIQGQIIEDMKKETPSPR
jgi:hypothetical protein